MADGSWGMWETFLTRSLHGPFLLRDLLTSILSTFGWQTPEQVENQVDFVIFTLDLFGVGSTLPVAAVITQWVRGTHAFDHIKHKRRQRGQMMAVCMCVCVVGMLTQITPH